jgi:uncharacterized protein (DUF433 family)
MPRHAASGPAVLLGKPIVRGIRVPVWLIVWLVEAGQAPEQIVADSPDLTIEDVDADIACTAQFAIPDAILQAHPTMGGRVRWHHRPLIGHKDPDPPAWRCDQPSTAVPGAIALRPA